ncbi:MAG: hypothetical protein D8M58_14495 [Calditrichaeota bacterium]|nr:MAG: hypothetical protein DWQ03_15735 [Calditrichota bacterium]MBL1206611.1 hypothetical protein [Calditrichota bacterium]NOG46438.1 nucleotidyltransferase domain-containing protein [Calditrichota bacterium]
MIYKKTYKSHSMLNKRATNSTERIDTLRKKFNNCLKDKFKDIVVYCVGSIGRGEVGNVSNLDLFILSKHEQKDISKLDELLLLAEIININQQLDYPDFSNDGRFLKVYSLKDMLGKLDSPLDDYENSFTARMLLLLESKAIHNNELYETFIVEIVDHYFRDKKDTDKFKPLFLLNDILRYWRTLCLNYEKTRNDKIKPWRKKNINLKYSRMLTIFGTILPIVALPVKNRDQFIELTKLTPLERFSYGLDIIGSYKTDKDYQKFLDLYENFLFCKENEKKEELTEKCRCNAENFSDYIYGALMHESINNELKKYWCCSLCIFYF